MLSLGRKIPCSSRETVQFQGKEIRWSLDAKYLGVIVDSKLATDRMVTIQGWHDDWCPSEGFRDYVHFVCVAADVLWLSSVKGESKVKFLWVVSMDSCNNP